MRVPAREPLDPKASVPDSIAPSTPRLVSVSGFEQEYPFKKTQIYIFMSLPDDPLPSVKIGGKRLIPMPEGAHWLERQARIVPLTTGHSKHLRQRDTEAATQRELARERGLHVAQTITKQQSVKRRRGRPRKSP
jgi:hypothetical protein